MQLRIKMLLTWIALPVYVWQGVGVRLRTERLRPPSGDPAGRISGRGQPVRLMVLGDSSAAGVGADAIEDTLAGQLAPLLAQKTGRPVEWRAAGFNSATSGQIRDHVVPNLGHEHWTHIVLSIGTNDVKNFHTLARFKREFGGLIYALRARFPGARIIWSPAIDMSAVPALSSPMSRLLEIRAKGFNRLGARLCAERGAVAVARMADVRPEGFSRDGFHAGPAGYRYWAEHLVQYLSDGSAP